MIPCEKVLKETENKDFSIEIMIGIILALTGKIRFQEKVLKIILSYSRCNTGHYLQGWIQRITVSF